jgi:serine/threonine protein kinase
MEPAMKPERWKKIEELYNQVVKLEPDQRGAFLEKECTSDESLREEVESLLRCESNVDQFIESPALEVAARQLAREQVNQGPLELTGRALLHYRVDEKIGEGGMGVVYKARDTHLDRFVAIKVLPPDRIADPERRRRFVQEAKAASALRHPNIVTIHDIAEESGVAFIVMEYVPGKPLSRLIPRKGLRVPEALKYAVQIADALAAAHAAGIIHRDLKPANIMADDNGAIKVLDFGLAKLTEEPESKPADASTGTVEPETEKGTIVGTVSYMSPEQAEGRRVDVRSDIFSFGSVLYEMLTGRRAFAGKTSASLIGSILKDEPRPIAELVPVAPPALDYVVRTCLAKNLEDRFQSVRDIWLQVTWIAGVAAGRPESRSTPPIVKHRERIAWSVASV